VRQEASCAPMREAAVASVRACGGESAVTGTHAADPLQYLTTDSVFSNGFCAGLAANFRVHSASPRLFILLIVALVSLRGTSVHAAPFDLTGPTLEVEVTRGARTLPAAEVPNLAVGDRVSVKADLPDRESAHYLMVAAFLRGATNPPPEQWFFACETWSRRCTKEGLTLTVPEEAQQLLVFLAPQTGGAYRTLVNAVRGRPGAFVRTSQDLNQAALDHARLDAYLAAIRHLGDVDPTQLKEAAPLLARSLAMKVDEACLGKIPVLQAPCLAQGRESLILDDGHGATLAQELTSGPASDLAMEASNTPQLKSGYYGPFIGSLIDIAKILDSLHTAQYQYFPALTAMHGRQVELTLNAPPSFHDPKSVLVVALPPVEPPQFPALHPVNPGEMLCAAKDPLVLPMEGAPVVFSTAYAHDSLVHLVRKDRSSLDLPARADPVHGGFVVSTASGAVRVPADVVTASVHGQWGFDHYDGPNFRLAGAQAWSLASGDSPDLIVGRAGTIHLRSDSVSCLDDISLTDAAAKPHKVEWKKSNANEVELTLPLQDVTAGDLTLRVRQFGRTDAQTLLLHGFSQPGHLESFTLHRGDTEGILRGNRLEEVKALTFDGVQFTPGILSSREGQDELSLMAQSGSDTRTLKGGEAQVTLSDGRRFDVKASVDSPRPSALLISKTVKRPAAASDNTIQLSNEAELPLEARLTFSLRARSPASFDSDEKLEVATTDGSFSVLLTVGAGVMLQSRKIAVVTLDPSKALGASAFGPLQFRRIVQGVAGEWAPLATLVRLPRVTGVICPADPDASCSLTGTNLFLLDSVSGDAAFARAMRVPDGFTEPVLPIPHPSQGRLFVKLRDDPAVINIAMLDVTTQPAASTEAASPGPEPLTGRPQPSVATPTASASAAAPAVSAATAAPAASASTAPAVSVSAAPPSAAPAPDSKSQAPAPLPAVTAVQSPPVHTPP
jgi:hypothetical protein